MDAEVTPSLTTDDGHPEWLAPRADMLANAWADRDLQWLQFNRRVLHEAQDDRTPLLERLKFLAIFTSNLDEFYMKRVGALRGRAHVDSEDDPVASTTDSRVRLRRIRAEVQPMLREQAE